MGPHVFGSLNEENGRAFYWIWLLVQQGKKSNLKYINTDRTFNVCYIQVGMTLKPIKVCVS